MTGARHYDLLQQHDAVVADELPDDHRRCHEGVTDDQDPLVGTVGVRNGKRVEERLVGDTLLRSVSNPARTIN